MADAVYPKGLENFGAGNIDYDANTIKITLIDAADYTYSSAHDAIDDVPAAARVASATLGTKTNTNGTLDAADPTFSAVTGDVSEALVIWKDSGVEATSWLIAYIDSYTGLPVTPNGGDITVAFPAAGILTL